MEIELDFMKKKRVNGDWDGMREGELCLLKIYYCLVLGVT